MKYSVLILAVILLAVIPDQTQNQPPPPLSKRRPPRKNGQALNNGPPPNGGLPPNGGAPPKNRPPTNSGLPNNGTSLPKNCNDLTSDCTIMITQGEECEDPQTRQQCCKTCTRFNFPPPNHPPPPPLPSSPHQDCNDSTPNCATIIKSGEECKDPLTRQQCCKTCMRFSPPPPPHYPPLPPPPPSPQDCNDLTPNCTTRITSGEDCKDHQTRQQCCKSCMRFSPPPPLNHLPPPPPLPPHDCKDLTPNCTSMITSRKECKAQSTRQQCCETCTKFHHPPPPNHLSHPPPPPPQDCFDSTPNCTAMITLGEECKNSLIKQQCCKTCMKFFPPPPLNHLPFPSPTPPKDCNDSAPNCTNMITSGEECKDPFTRQQCCKSCIRFSPLPPLNHIPPPPRPPPQDCNDLTPNCTKKKKVPTATLR